TAPSTATSTSASASCGSKPTAHLGVRRHDAALDGETRLAAPSAPVSCEYPGDHRMQAGRRAAPSKAETCLRTPNFCKKRRVDGVSRACQIGRMLRCTESLRPEPTW